MTLGKLALGAGAATLGAAVWWRRNPSACPYGQRLFIEAPRPFITRGRLGEILAPVPGERILELGPGTGYYAVPVAEWLTGGDGERAPGRLDVFDLQQQMLDHTMRVAAERGVSNIEPAQGDARAMPYADGTFDAAYLVTVLGEIPDQDAALRELRRVLKPTGRLVVGEIALDPHFVPFGRLCERAQAAGLRYERRLGSAIAYFSRFAAA